jgi:hypothetical protein
MAEGVRVGLPNPRQGADDGLPIMGDPFELMAEILEVIGLTRMPSASSIAGRKLASESNQAQGRNIGGPNQEAPSWPESRLFDHAHGQAALIRTGQPSVARERRSTYVATPRMLETDLEDPCYVRSVRGTGYLFAFEFRPWDRLHTRSVSGDGPDAVSADRPISPRIISKFASSRLPLKYFNANRICVAVPPRLASRFAGAETSLLSKMATGGVRIQPQATWRSHSVNSLLSKSNILLTR